MIQDPDDILELARYPADRLADTAVLVNVGTRSLLELQDGQRLFREAGFLLVFGSRSAIRASLIKRLLVPPE